MLHSLKNKIKTSDHFVYRVLKATYYNIRNFEIPSIPLLHSGLLGAHKFIIGILGYLTRVIYWTPLFKSLIQGPCRKLYLYGGMPLVTGPLSISIGKDCRISGATTFSGRWSSNPKPSLIIGNNVGIGWQTTIAIGTTVKLGNNVRIAGRSFIAGYPGHPLNAEDRAVGLPDTQDQIGDIILDDNVWLGTNVTVLPRVHIGAGTVVAAGSVVTKNLPANVLAAGVPAKVIRHIGPENQTKIMEFSK